MQAVGQYGPLPQPHSPTGTGLKRLQSDEAPVDRRDANLAQDGENPPKSTVTFGFA
jgi:hypothetical protein